MSREQKTECPSGHSYIEHGRLYRGSWICKECDRIRKRVEMQVTKDRLTELEAEVVRLRQAYAASPKSAALSAAFGEASQSLISAKRQERFDREAPAREAAREARLAEQAAARAYRPLTNGAWADALPKHCPACDGRGVRDFDPPYRASGFSVRLGDLGVRCSLCQHEYSIGSE